MGFGSLADSLRISVREDRNSHSVVRTATFNAVGGSRTIFFEISGDVLPPPLEVYDFAVVAALFVAMREGRAMHVEGPVTETLIRNLEEFQEAWSLWRPSYTPIRITADQMLHDKTSSSLRRGVFAVSGGVDGTFALLRHHCGHSGLRTARPECAVLIHGFDLPLAEVQAYERARSAIAAMTSTLGVPLSTVRTNWRDVACKTWTLEFAGGLAACLHLFQGVANVGILGADEDYGHIELPWGSNPITNPLLSGGGFEIHTEGGGFTRTDRVRLICDYPEIAVQLRVCWEGPMTGGNCGRCEKCIRTKLNFMANGREPLCFDRRPTHAEIVGILARNQVQLSYLREILTAARKNGESGPWISSLKLAVAKNRLALPARQLRQRIAAKLRPLIHNSKEKARRDVAPQSASPSQSNAPMSAAGGRGEP